MRKHRNRDTDATDLLTEEEEEEDLDPLTSSDEEDNTDEKAESIRVDTDLSGDVLVHVLPRDNFTGDTYWRDGRQFSSAEPNKMKGKDLTVKQIADPTLVITDAKGKPVDELQQAKMDRFEGKVISATDRGDGRSLPPLRSGPPVEVTPGEEGKLPTVTLQRSKESAGYAGNHPDLLPKVSNVPPEP